ncbi:unnamed protein product [Urochloa decumbens]|uniref:F-box protein AT5G49610-like beta-propeller domain-containing protein n=1 Tax=Urochloa decumbens TaxID=240449 RepID=A0ABC9ELC8_9POAL
MPSLPVVEDDDSASMVLTNEGLAIIQSFRSLQSRHLLGVYICTENFSKPQFVPLADALSSELGAAIRHGNFRFDNMDTFFMNVWDCRNDRVLYGFSGSFNLPLCPAVRMPLHTLGQDTFVLPPQPSTTWFDCPHAMLLPDEDGGDISCYRLDIFYKGWMVCARVFVLQAGSWATHSASVADLVRPPKEILKKTLLMRGKIYMLTTAGYILAFHLANRNFFTVDLPEGVKFEYFNNLALCRGDDSVIYLFHLKGDKLTVWLQRMTDDLKGDRLTVSAISAQWVLRDTISMQETCGHLIDKGCIRYVSVVGVGDNAECLFLEFEGNGIIMYMHLKSRKVKLVCKRGPYNDFAIRVLPFMMTWPVVFPKLGAGEGLHQDSGVATSLVE